LSRALIELLRSAERAMADAMLNRNTGGTNAAARPHRIVVVGGGAGGLELATRLGDKLGRRGRAEIALIDKARTHLWKPLLHEIRPAAWIWAIMNLIIWRRPTGIISNTAPEK